MELLYNALLLMLIVLAVSVTVIRKLRVVAIVFGVFSAVASVCYLLLAAPDVALAEAVIGCTISTVIFLAGIRKYKTCTVCVLPSEPEMESKILKIIDIYTFKKELEPHYIHKSSRDEMELIFYDIGCRLNRDGIVLYGEPESYVMAEVIEEIEKAFPDMYIDVQSPLYDEV